MSKNLPIDPWQQWNIEIKTAVEDSESLCVGVFSLDGELLFANSAMKVLFKATPKDSFLNPPFDSLVAANSDISPIFKGIMTIGSMDSSNNVSIKAKVFKNQEQILIVGEIDVKELILVNNKLIDLNNEINDLQRNLLKAKKIAEAANAANRAKSDYLTYMSHEIRTPLNGVIGFTDLLMKTKLEDVQMVHLGIIFRSANSLLDLLNGILDFSKIESGKLELNMERVDLFTLIEQALDLIKYKLQEKKIKLSVQISANAPRFILTDPIRLRQILSNLIGNALKFTTEGEIEIEVKLLDKNQLTNEAKLFFSVSDTGIGISKENQFKIFHAFEQADSSISRKYGGTGLGLPISNKLLALMSSKLEIESEYKKGSKFHFTIIVKMADNEDNSQQNIVVPEVETINGKSIFAGYVKVLIVDDDVINLFLAKSILTKILPNAMIHEAQNGIEAIEQFQAKKPDIIFMDMQMPEMNGDEATMKIRNLESSGRVPIIALTADASLEDIEKFFLIGMDDYASKPIVMNTIETILIKWLGVK